MRRQSWIASALTLFVCASSAHAGNVFIVDAAHPPGTQPDIQSAINLSADGDAILVRSGSYLRFDLPDRELSIVAEQGAVVSVTGAPVLATLSASRTLLLGGLIISGGYGVGAPNADGLILSNATGSVRIEDCSITAAVAQPIDNCSPRRGVVVQNCQDVAFTRCYVRGQSGANANFAKGGIGVHGNVSKISFYDCTVLGGQGGGADGCSQVDVANDLNCHYAYAMTGDGADGGPACRFSLCEVMFSGSVVRGGDGGATHPFPWPFHVGGCGGDGIDTVGAALIWGLATAPAGGVGAPGDPPNSFTNGTDGVPLSPNPMQFTTLPGASRSFRAPLVVREGTAIPLHLEGLPGDRAALLLNYDPARLPYMPFGGWYLVQRPPGSRFVRLGMLDGAGYLDTNIVVGELGPGVLTRTLFLQTIHADVSGVHTLGPTQSVVVVDSSL